MMGAGIFPVPFCTFVKSFCDGQEDYRDRRKESGPGGH